VTNAAIERREVTTTFPLLDYRGSLPHPKYEDHFKVYEHIRDSEYCDGDRAALRDLWDQFEKLGLADPDFVDRFPTEFGSRVWEMRLACTFAGWGWKLVPTKKRGHGPGLRDRDEQRARHVGRGDRAWQRGRR
jgi:hypothetical protein